MQLLTPQKIAEATGGKYVGTAQMAHIPVRGAVRDNRGVKPGNLFICIRGARVDGHSFAPAAFAAGASCCLAEQPLPNPAGPYVLVESTLIALKTLGEYYRSLFSIPIIGITGSVGKTTAKEMTAAVLGQKYKILKTPENLNNEIGVPLTLLSLDESHEAAVIEMGISEFGEMSRLARMVRPDICLMTKIGYSHIETLGDLNGVLRAKSEVFGFMKRGGIAVVNGDDDLLRGFDPGMRKITFGTGLYNDYHAGNIASEGTDSVSCDIVSSSGRLSVKIPAYGNHLVLAALPAAAIGRELGLSDTEIARGILSYAPVGGRARVFTTSRVRLIDDCYNANPNSVRAALDSLSALPGTRTAILGDMKELGADSGTLHSEIGEYARQMGIDTLICCGDMAKSIYDGFITAGGKNAHYFTNKPELIAALPALITDGSNVLVKASHSMRFDEITDFLNQN